MRCWRRCRIGWLPYFRLDDLGQGVLLALNMLDIWNGACGARPYLSRIQFNCGATRLLWPPDRPSQFGLSVTELESFTFQPRGVRVMVSNCTAQSRMVFTAWP